MTACVGGNERGGRRWLGGGGRSGGAEGGQGNACWNEASTMSRQRGENRRRGKTHADPITRNPPPRHPPAGKQTPRVVLTKPWKSSVYSTQQTTRDRRRACIPSVSKRCLLDVARSELHALACASVHSTLRPTTTPPQPHLASRIEKSTTISRDPLISSNHEKKRCTPISMAISRELTGSNDDEPYVSLERRLPGQFDN